MEDRLATMRAGLKRRLQEMRDERAAGGRRGGGVAGKGSGEGASGAGAPIISDRQQQTGDDGR